MHALAQFMQYISFAKESFMLFVSVLWWRLLLLFGRKEIYFECMSVAASEQSWPAISPEAQETRVRRLHQSSQLWAVLTSIRLQTIRHSQSACCIDDVYSTAANLMLIILFDLGLDIISVAYSLPMV
jgi:hypothetical protein